MDYGLAALPVVLARLRAEPAAILYSRASARRRPVVLQQADGPGGGRVVSTVLVSPAVAGLVRAVESSTPPSHSDKADSSTSPTLLVKSVTLEDRVPPGI